MQTITITKKAALLISLGFITTVAVVAAGSVAWASHNFSDVPSDHQFHDSISYAANTGIANGFQDGTYRPSEAVTRGQMAAFIHRSSGNAPGVGASVNAASLGGNSASSILSRLQTVETKLQFVSIIGNTMRISGGNLQIVDGSGTTGGAVNGLGNLIVGYNENGFSRARTGSHNLVIGVDHGYSSYGGVVAGENNTISGTNASVTGGYGHWASGDYSSVTGGSTNTASGFLSSVTGGYTNTASGNSAAVTGGYSNSASALYSSVAGGNTNTSSGQYASVTGGYLNVSNGHAASITGGAQNSASGGFAVVSGGGSNSATGSHATVSGGNQNRAGGAAGSAFYATVGGGLQDNADGDWDWRAGTLFTND